MNKQFNNYLLNKESIKEGLTPSYKSGWPSLSKTDCILSFQPVSSDSEITLYFYQNESELFAGELGQVTFTSDMLVNGRHSYDCSAYGSIHKIEGFSNQPSAGQIQGEVILPNNLETICDYMFTECYNITNVNIPEGVTYIGLRAFNDCISLSEITIPTTVTVVKIKAFQGCANLKSVIWNAISVTEDWDHEPYGIFGNGSDGITGLCPISSFVFGNKVKTIPSFLCQNLNEINDITIPDSVIEIGYDAFNSRNINNVTLGKNIKSLASFNFYRQLHQPITITTYSTTPIAADTDFFETYNVTIYVPANLVDAYKSDTNWCNADRFTILPIQ